MLKLKIALTELKTEDLDELGILLKAMAHPTRLWILQFLSRQDCCISGEIADELPIARSTVSEHLRLLKEAGLIQGEIEHPKIKYCINKDKWERTKFLIEVLLNHPIHSREVKKCTTLK